MRAMKDSGVEWIGEIPEKWEIKNIKSFFSFGKGLPITKENLRDSGVPVISYGQIHGKYNPGTRLVNELFRHVDAEYLESDPAALVHRGDFIFADTSEDIEGCGNCCYIAEEMQLFAGYHTIVLFAQRQRDNSYLAYLFQTDPWRSQIRRELVEVKVYSISRRVLRKTTILLPPADEQQRIASYLDAQCAEIDNVVAKTRESIEEYKKLKQSTITEAVTKGLDPTVKMKDSGIEWIGEIPEGWKKDKVCRVFKTIGSGTTPKSSDADAYDGDVNWIQSGDINGSLLVRSSKNVSMHTVEEYSALKIYKKPFIVIAMYGASIGNLSISQIDACVNQACCVLGSCSGYFQFMFYSLMAAKAYFVHQGIGGGQPNISQETIKQLWIPLPPTPEQAAIASYLDAQCAEIDQLIAKKEQVITELENYKKSLIYECVTGKREVC